MSSEDPLQLERLYIAADSVAARYDTDTYLYSGPLNGIGFANIVAAVLEQAQRPNCLLILTTNGGDLNIAYQIARFLHSKYVDLFVCTPGFCKSAGALVALGAHKILADEYSEFGPIDGNTYNSEGSTKDGGGAMATFEFGLDCSLDIVERALLRIRRAAADNIRLDVAAGLSLLAALAVMRPCFSQINFATVRKEQRDLSIALAYGQRLADHAQNMRDGAVEKLVKGYPSHEFIIDYTEAQDLFASIEKPASELYQLLGCLGDSVYTQQQFALVKRVQRPLSQATDNRGGFEGPPGRPQRPGQGADELVPEVIRQTSGLKEKQGRRSKTGKSAKRQTRPKSG